MGPIMPLLTAPAKPNTNCATVQQRVRLGFALIFIGFIGTASKEMVSLYCVSKWV